MKRPSKFTPETFVKSYAEQGGLNNVKKATGQKRLFYLSGAITDDPHAVLKFALAEEIVKREGNCAINPLKRHPLNMKWEDAILADLGIINQLGAFYRASLPYLGIIPKLPLPALLLIDPIERPLESRGVKLEKGIALANGIPVVQFAMKGWNETLEHAIRESEETK